MRAFALLACLLLTEQAGADMARFQSWLGVWERTEASGRVTRERWWQDGTSLRAEAHYRDSTTSEWTTSESILLTELDGTIYYIAKPTQNGMPVPFHLVTKDGPAVFENRTHDFPQRICYAVQSDGSLDVWIDSPSQGESNRTDYHFERPREH